MKRLTKQREAILRCFSASLHPLSIEEIYQQTLSDIPRINLATVYRNIKMLLEEELISSVILPGETPRYEMANLSHHHHFLCLLCNRLYDIPGCPSGLSSLVPRGFKMVDHSIHLNGYCKKCNQLRKK